MSSDIVNRRKQIFNAFRVNNTTLETEVVVPEMKEGLNLLNNSACVDACTPSNNTAAAEPDSSMNDESISDNIVILNDEDGSEIRFEFLDLITYRKKEYVVLLPIDGDTDQVVILQVESIGADEESYISVDNEYTLETVFSLFKERHQHEFDFVD